MLTMNKLNNTTHCLHVEAYRQPKQNKEKLSLIPITLSDVIVWYNLVVTLTINSI